MSRPRPLYATCDHGLEGVLAAELEALGLESVKAGHRGVIFAGDRVDLWRVNLESRIANRVLMPIAEFPAPDRQSLYDGVARIDWPAWFDVRRTFAIDATAHKSQHAHAGFVALVAKDAICDVFRDKLKRRPSVERERPDVRINVRLDQDHCIVSLDSSGRRLHERGYRRDGGEAPLKETLAAGILALTGWTPDQPLFDPMCGSGTFLIEGAMMAADIAPGISRVGRSGFAFERWADHDSGPFGTLVDHTRRRARADLSDLRIIGADTDEEAIRRAHRNAKLAGVADGLRLRRQTLEDARPSDPDGVLVVNPPYGERLGRDLDLGALYGQLGHVLKHQFEGYKAWVFAAEAAPIKRIGLRPSAKLPLRNGPIDCLLLGYELYAGTQA